MGELCLLYYFFYQSLGQTITGFFYDKIFKFLFGNR